MENCPGLIKKSECHVQNTRRKFARLPEEGDSVLGDGEVVGGTAETQHAVPGTGDAVDVPLAVFGNLDLGIVGLFRDNGSGLGGHGMDAASGEVQRLGRAVRLDNFSE